MVRVGVDTEMELYELEKYQLPTKLKCEGLQVVIIQLARVCNIVKNIQKIRFLDPILKNPDLLTCSS